MSSSMTINNSLVIFSLILLCSKTACGSNVTQLLQGYPDFSKMTEVLNQPDVVKQINIQPTVTILGLDNDQMDKLNGVKRPEEVTDIVKAHVILDYYDDVKLKNQPLNKALEVVNLYQSSGYSQSGQGLIKLKRTTEGIFFYSTSKNSSENDAKLMEKIYARQFNVSIVRIDHPVYIFGLNDDMAPVLPPVQPKAPKVKGAESPEELVAEAPSDETYAPAPSPASDAPEKKADDADDSANDDQAESSAGKRGVGLVVVLASAFVAAVAF